MFKILGLSWLIILVILLIISIISYFIRKSKNKKIDNVLIISKPEQFKKVKQLNLSDFDTSINDFLGNTTKFTLLTWMIVNPVNRDSFLKKSNFPLTNILCKGEVDNPLPLILYNHYTNSLYFYVPLGNKFNFKNTTNEIHKRKGYKDPGSFWNLFRQKTTEYESKLEVTTQIGLLRQIEIFGENFWKDMENHPENYPDVYIIPNILVGRWFQLGFSINNNVIEIYLNGKLKKTFILQSNVITDTKQNLITLGPISAASDKKVNSAFTSGQVGQDPTSEYSGSKTDVKYIKIDGFKGELSGLRYSSKIMSIKSINDIYQQGLNNNSFSNSKTVQKSQFAIKPISIMKPIKVKKNMKLIKKNQTVDSLNKNNTLIEQACNSKDYIPNPLPNQPNCKSDCDCFGVAKCNEKTKKCDSSNQYSVNTDKKPDCVLITTSNDIADNNLGLLSESHVNSYVCDNLCYQKNNISQITPNCKPRNGQEEGFGLKCSLAKTTEDCMKVDPWKGTKVSSRCLWTNMNPKSEGCTPLSGQQGWNKQCSGSKNINDCMNVDPWNKSNVPNLIKLGEKVYTPVIKRWMKMNQMYNLKDKTFNVSSRCEWAPTKKQILEDCTQSIFDKDTEKCYKNNKGDVTKNYCNNPKSSIKVNTINPNMTAENCCINYANTNAPDQSKGDSTRIVNSWDNIPYGCISSNIDSSNPSERYVWYNTNHNSKASLGPNQRRVDQCS